MNINRICQLTGITEQQLYSKKRTQNLVRVRFFIWYKLYHKGMTYQAIANMFSYKRHTSIMHGVRKEQDRRYIKSKRNKLIYL